MHVPPPPPVYSWHPPPLVSHSPRLALKTRRTRGESTRKSEIAARPARGCEKPHNDTLPYIDVPFYVYTHSATDFVPRYIMHAFCALTPEASISEPGNRGWERPRRGGIDLESKKKNRRVPRLFSDFEWFRDSRRLQMNQIRTWFRGHGFVASLRILSLFLSSREVLENGIERWKSFSNRKFSSVSAQWPNIFVFFISVSPNFHNSFQFYDTLFFITRFWESVCTGETSNKSNLTCASSRF